MRRIHPADLTTFLSIAKHRNFRRAAEELQVTPSALSHALRNLEEQIDIRLFNRTSRSVALTEAGERLHRRVQPAFREIEEALDELSGFTGRPTGTVRISASHIAAQTLLFPLVQRFIKAHPAVNIEIVVQGNLLDIISSGFDAGVRLGEKIAADMIAVPLGPRQRSVVVATPAFFKRWPKPSTPHDLRDIPCVRFRYESGQEYKWEFERGEAELEIAVDGPFATTSMDLMLQAALDGMGAACLYESQVSEHVSSGRLVKALEDWCPDYPGYHLYYPSSRQMPTALRAFIDYVRRKDEPHQSQIG
jgi:DNA-binding transcriptional LysR family regulator